MENTNKTDGKTSTESVGVTETQKTKMCCICGEENRTVLAQVRGKGIITCSDCDARDWDIECGGAE